MIRLIFSPRELAGSAIAFLVMACSASAPNPDGEPDGGTPAADSGANPADTSTTPGDSGTAPGDANAPSSDSGSPSDSGTMPSSEASTPKDSGSGATLPPAAGTTGPTGPSTGLIVQVTNLCPVDVWIHGTGGGGTLTPDNVQLVPGASQQYNAPLTWAAARVYAYLEAPDGNGNPQGQNDKIEM